ncbi:MAG: hypothetical protein U9R75_01320 [Candidatus Thermoplasmatota archaeon]|nr:hypothetical protein [Candidatus Thermoplasmatota archaeon]
MSIDRSILVLVVTSTVFTSGMIGILFLDHEQNHYSFIPPDDLGRFDLPDNRGLNVSIMASLQSAGDYLVSHIQDSGKFDYQYDPIADRNVNKYNVLRHSATTYSLALIFKYTRDPDHYNCTISTLNYVLSRYMASGEIDGTRVAYIVKNGYAKLGGAALTVLAVSEVEKLDPFAHYETELSLLGEFILKMQKDDGSFQCFHLSKENEHSDYYPGEAMLALARLYDAKKDTRYLEALEKGFKHYNPYFGNRYSAYSPWAVEAMVYTSQWIENSSYVEYCYDTADSCRAGQNLPERTSEDKLIGSWGSNPTSASASKIEAVIDSYLLAKRLNDTEEEKRFKASSELGARFLMNFQFDEEEAKLFPSPERVVGGFPQSYENSDIRIDQVQHAVVVLAKLMVYQGTENHV